MNYHLIVYVPLSDAENVRDALANAGAGRIGAYDTCSFSTRGIGRFRPLKGSRPFIGKAGAIEEVEEERIEVIIPETVDLQSVLAAVRSAHPYEEPAIHVLPMATQ